MPTLLEIADLQVAFDTDDGVVRAVTGASLRLDRGEVLGLVGESGCGKTATAMSVPRLLPRPAARVAGRVLFDGRDLLALPLAEMRALRGRRIGVIFQVIGILFFVLNLIYSYIKGKKAGDDPWDAWSLEWATTSPPPSYNFETIPEVRSRRPLWDLKHPDDPDWKYE